MVKPSIGWLFNREMQRKIMIDHPSTCQILSYFSGFCHHESDDLTMKLYGLPIGKRLPMGKPSIMFTETPKIMMVKPC